MQEYIITLETALLAKQKGFNIPTVHYYTNRLLTPEDKKLGYSFENNHVPYKLEESFVGETDKYVKLKDLLVFRNFDINAPTQNLLQQWLREIHNIEVSVLPLFREKCGYDSFKRDGFSFEIITTNPCQYLDFLSFNRDMENREHPEDKEFYNLSYSKYEDALEKGLEKGLMLIK